MHCSNSDLGSKFYLSYNKIASVNNYKGKLRVDIREYSKGFPTKKGISLDLNLWRVLCEKIPAI